MLQGAQLRQHIDATLGSGNLREAVRLPPGEDFNEWLAVNSTLSLSLLACLLVIMGLCALIDSQMAPLQVVLSKINKLID